MNKLKITDTTLRDAHQSLWATRMRTEDMVPVLEDIDQIGYHSLEMWGGATFDVCIRFLNEDPWERIRIIKKHVRKTPLQMLLRGQSLVGYSHYSDDVVDRFVPKAAENGIDIFRIFDALNDIRNFERPMRAVKATGAHAQAAVVYTLSPVHTTQHYLETALRLEDMGADSICIKDMAGMLAPYVSYELVSLFKEKLSVPIQLHTHYIGGMAVGACLKAAEAGVDVIDTATGPLAFGSSQPPVETIVRALQGTPYDTGLDIHKLFDVANYFEDLRKKRGFERGVTRITAMKVFDHQVPGGMISNFVSQLEEQKALHRIGEALEEIQRVREDLGYPPLVTPTSQIVGNQAVLNVLSGERYKMVPREVKDYVRGLYGKPPAPITDEIRKMIVGDQPVIDCRPADILENRWPKLSEEIKDMAESEEDVISYALFPPVARKFFEWRKKVRDEGLPVEAEAKKEAAPKVSHGPQPVKAPGAPVSKEEGRMHLKEIRELIKMLDETEITELNLESEGFKISIKKGNASGETLPQAAPASPAARETAPPAMEEGKSTAGLVPVVAPMVGTFYGAPAPDAPSFVEVGSRVKAGQVVCIIEAMKLMNEIEAEVDGKIVEILVENGQPLEYGQELFLIAEE